MLEMIPLSDFEAPNTLLEVREFLDHWYSDAAFIQQNTSGSTDLPKKIDIEKIKMMASAQMTGTFFGLENCTTGLLCISPSYIGGKMMIVRALTYDLKLYYSAIRSNPLIHLEEDIDFCAMVPLQVKTILKEAPEQLNRIRYLIIGGAPIDEEMEQQLALLKCSAYATFGMTETISHVALKKLDGSGSPFNAIGNTTFKADKDGRLIISAPDLGIDALVTNDVVEIISKNAFYWKGRYDNVINTGGVKVHPETIEKKLSPYLPADSYFVSGLNDATFGEIVVFVHTNPTLTKENVTQLFAHHLSRFEQPKKIFHVSHILFTENGKIQRKATLKLHHIE